MARAPVTGGPIPPEVMRTVALNRLLQAAPVAALDTPHTVLAYVRGLLRARPTLDGREVLSLLAQAGMSEDGWREAARLPTPAAVHAHRREVRAAFLTRHGLTPSPPAVRGADGTGRTPGRPFPDGPVVSTADGRAGAGHSRVGEEARRQRHPPGPGAAVHGRSR
jgi:hypothetical protein